MCVRATCSRRHFSALVFDIQKVKALEDSYKKCPNRAMGGAIGTKIRSASLVGSPLLGLVPLSFRSAEPGPGGGRLPYWDYGFSYLWLRPYVSFFLFSGQIREGARKVLFLLSKIPLYLYHLILLYNYIFTISCETYSFLYILLF